MKQLKRLTALCFCAVALLSGCTKFGTAVSEITATEYENKMLTVTAMVTDNGGCDYYMDTFTLPMVDTAYYVCAYVKNSAGLSYSPPVRVPTDN